MSVHMLALNKYGKADIGILLDNVCVVLICHLIVIIVIVFHSFLVP